MSAIVQSELVYTYMPPQHVEAFKRAAVHFKCWILVRRGNKDSLEYIGKTGYIPKAADCKAKTADKNFKDKKYAGLVTSPVLVPEAFSAHRLDKAMKEWVKFQSHLYTFNRDDLRANLAADKAGKHYTLQTDEKHVHYGCVMYKPVYRSAAEYIYSDYDLYAVVPADNPHDNVFSVQRDEANKIVSAQGKMLMNVQYFVKAAGEMRGAQEPRTPMIRHGEQETFMTDYADPLDVFWPDGIRITDLEPGQSIKDFYEKIFNGRQQMVTGETILRNVYGNWWRT